MSFTLKKLFVCVCCGSSTQGKFSREWKALGKSLLARLRSLNPSECVRKHPKWRFKLKVVILRTPLPCDALSLCWWQLLQFFLFSVTSHTFSLNPAEREKFFFCCSMNSWTRATRIFASALALKRYWKVEKFFLFFLWKDVGADGEKGKQGLGDFFGDEGELRGFGWMIESLRSSTIVWRECRKLKTRWRVAFNVVQSWLEVCWCSTGYWNSTPSFKRPESCLDDGPLADDPAELGALPFNPQVHHQVHQVACSHLHLTKCPNEVYNLLQVSHQIQAQSLHTVVWDDSECSQERWKHTESWRMTHIPLNNTPNFHQSLWNPNSFPKTPFSIFSALPSKPMKLSSL
jgi:hypothetical protein